jgi:hypothetical protein
VSYPKDWDEEKIKEWKNDLDLTSQIMYLFCQMSPGSKRRMAYILRISIEGLEEEREQREQREESSE